MDQTERRERIETAAYDVLADKGFKGASMLAIAKKAKASNETLYKWYGDKTGLFAAIIQKNASLVEAELLRVRNSGATGPEALHAVGRTLLSMVTAEKAIALNRAAAGDITGALGALLAKEGRAHVAPIIEALLGEIYGPQDDLPERTETYIALLIGDLQIRRVIAALKPLSESEIDARADRALRHFLLIYPEQTETAT